MRKRLAALEDPESLKWLLRKVVGSKKYPMPLQLTAGRTAGGAGDAVLEDLAQTLRRARKPETIVVLLDGIGLCAVSARGCEDIVLPLLRHKEGAVRERAALALSKIAVVEAIEPMSPVERVGGTKGFSALRLRPQWFRVLAWYPRFAADCGSSAA